MNFEQSSANFLKTANDLISHIRHNLSDTSSRKQWTRGNLNALRTFRIPNCPLEFFPFPDGDVPSKSQGQFLWDFIAYAPGMGIMLAAESEWQENRVDPRGLLHDFEKLLYVKSPIKLMMCRRDERNKGQDIADALNKYARDVCSNYSAGEVFILYCVGWSDEPSRNDEVFVWQVPGPVVSCIDNHFEFKAQ